MAKQFCLLSIIVTFFATSCDSQPRQKNGLEQIAISPDDNSILFSYFENEMSSLYKMSLKDNKVRIVLKSASDTSYTNPKYSSDGKKILFIADSRESGYSNIFMANPDGTDKKQLSFGNNIITEAIFSSDDRMIYFIKALEKEKYSTIARRAVHNFDVYCLNLETKVEKKLTNSNAYMLSKISEVESRFIIMESFHGTGNGMYIFSLENPDSIKPITPLNDPRKGLCSDFGSPQYSTMHNILAFTAPYELYVMNISDRQAIKIYRDTGQIIQIVFFNTQNKLLFTLFGRDEIKSIGLDGTNVKSIPININ